MDHYSTGSIPPGRTLQWRLLQAHVYTTEPAGSEAHEVRLTPSRQLPGSSKAALTAIINNQSKRPNSPRSNVYCVESLIIVVLLYCRWSNKTEPVGSEVCESSSHHSRLFKTLRHL